MDTEQKRRLEQLAPLADAVRRRVYGAVAQRFPDPVDRDTVADAAGVSRNLAAFHLDRLAEAGLVEVSYARRSWRSGPGAGRPAKFYRRAADSIGVSLPRRRFEMAARVLGRAVTGKRARAKVADEARREGQRVRARARPYRS